MPKEIALSQYKVTVVDDEDYEYLSQWKWYASCERGRWYAARRNPDTPGIIKMHRVIMNTPYDLEVDHKDWNGLNNQKNNLRNCTHAENNQNKKDTGNGYQGVFKNTNAATFMARIVVNYKPLYLGSFKTQRDAALAYNRAALIYFGSNAKLNII